MTNIAEVLSEETPMGVLSKIRREAEFFLFAVRLKGLVDPISPDSEQLVADDFEQSVDRNPENVAFRFEGKLLTYAEFDTQANRAANWAISNGLKAGDAVALFMENRPDYVAIWAGLSKSAWSRLL